MGRKAFRLLMGKEKAGKGAKSGRYSARVLRLMEKEEAFLETEHMVGRKLFLWPDAVLHRPLPDAGVFAGGVFWAGEIAGVRQPYRLIG